MELGLKNRLFRFFLLEVLVMSVVNFGCGFWGLDCVGIKGFYSCRLELSL